MATAPVYNEPILSQMGLPAGSQTLDGRGIAIGFADWGFDLLHPCLLEERGRRSRFEWILDQNDSDIGPADGFAGCPRTCATLNRAAIDGLLAETRRQHSRAPLDAVLDPHQNYCWHEIPEEGAHGTLMASIAAGTPHAGFRGVAPGASLLGVQLALRESDWKEVDDTGEPTWRDWSPVKQPNWNGWRSYDEAPQIASAVTALYDRASASSAAGLVINLSLGASAGAHDGSSTVARCISSVIEHGAGKGEVPTLVVLAAGNAGADEGHFAGEAKPLAPAVFTWRMSPTDPTPNKLEIWYCAAQPLHIELLLGEVGTDQRSPLVSYEIGKGPTVPIVLGGRLSGIADHVHNVRNGLSRVRIVLHPPYFPRAIPRDVHGDIIFTLWLGGPSDDPVSINAWLERDDGLQERSCLSPCHPAGTLGSIAMTEGAIAVSGFDHRDTAGGAAMFALSSLGPPPWPQLRSTGAPHIAAPGVGIWGARSKSHGFARTTGTSPAAAIVSGAAALMMQAAAAAGRPICARQTRDNLIALARPIDSAERQWSPRYGWGAVNLQHQYGERRS